MTWASGARRVAEVADSVRVRAPTGLIPRRVDRPGEWRFVRNLAIAVLAIVAAVECTIVIHAALEGPALGLLFRDFNLYAEATRRWMAGGPFYEPYQLIGPYDRPWGQIYYPPQALALFVPFTFLGAALFIVIPAVITLAMIWSYRPGLTPWSAILLLLVLHPDAPLIWIAGTPTIWVVALVALATRWRWVSAFIWFKPSVFPFALVGLRDRRWWAVTGAFALSAVLLWPMMIEWLTALTNARGENSGFLYSLSPTALADPLIPVIAYLGRRRPAEPATVAGATAV